MKYLPLSSDVPSKLQKKSTPQTSNDAQTAWKKFKDKDDVRKKLYPRQNGLCVYCEINIELHNKNKNGIGSHVEHILPKETHPQLTFDYDNLILSCFATGGEIKADEKDPAPVSCGHATLKRTNDFDVSLFIKPTDSDCEHYFSFELDGSVTAHPELNSSEIDKAEHTWQVLNLNCLRLKRLREDTITQLYEIFSELQNDNNALNLFLSQELKETKSFINARKQHFS
jgi:uncharacterized protein (TIGR02646 family)